ncbi:MAG: hypothetical protein M4579_000655 [Chaenotheca gracillima]|nr:MAG: hypothetical protein M4579_000655 [Chaenotheca gracillima]
MYATALTKALFLGMVASVAALPQLALPGDNPRGICFGPGGGDFQTDIVACPAQPDAVNLICGGDGSNNIGGDGGDAICYPQGQSSADTNGCICLNGNFCCDNLAKVPGGESVGNYFTDVGCNCEG